MKNKIIKCLMGFAISVFLSTAFACDVNPGIIRFIGMNDLSSLVCIKEGSAYYKNGVYAGSQGGSWYHSNGVYAGSKGGSWYHSNGVYAGSQGGSWYHSNGVNAGSIGGSWYYSNGANAGSLF